MIFLWEVTIGLDDSFTLKRWQYIIQIIDELGQRRISASLGEVGLNREMIYMIG